MLISTLAYENIYIRKVTHPTIVQTNIIVRMPILENWGNGLEIFCGYIANSPHTSIYKCLQLTHTYMHTDTNTHIQPQGLENGIKKINWRAGASQPSRRTDTIFLYISIRRGHIPYNALRITSKSARHNCRKMADSTGKTRIFLPIPETSHFPQHAAHFSQCSLLYSWLQRVLQPLWKAWMGLPHQQLVVAVALRLVGGGWNVSVHAGGSALLQKQQRRGRGVCLSVELGTEHDVPPAPRRPARHASCRWGLLSVEDERQKLPTRQRLAWLSPESTLLAYEHMFMLNDLSFSEDCAR